VLKKIICFSTIVVLLGIGIVVSQDKKAPLADRHKDRGLPCSVCHGGEDAPTTAASGKSCLICHNSLAAVADRTKGFVSNPHKNHLTEANDLECTQCHKGHKEDTILCHRCHAGMKFKN